MKRSRVKLVLLAVKAAVVGMAREAAVTAAIAVGLIAKSVP